MNASSGSCLFNPEAQFCQSRAGGGSTRLLDLVVFPSLALNSIRFYLSSVHNDRPGCFTETQSLTPEGHWQ